MQCLSTGLAVLLALIGGRQSSKHFDLAHYVGRTYSYETNRSEFEQLCRFLVRKVPTEKIYVIGWSGNSLNVWKLKNQMLIFVGANSLSVPGSSTARIYSFDSKENLTWSQSFSIGNRTYFEKTSLTASPYSPQPFLDITTIGWGGFQTRQVYGFDGNRLALIRFEDSKGRPLEISFEQRPPDFGPLPRSYNKASLLAALGNGDTVQILESLNWLNARHITTTSQGSKPWEELAADSKTFHALLDDPDVLKAVTPLLSSPMPWIHAAAKSFAVHFRARRRVKQSSHGKR